MMPIVPSVKQTTYSVVVQHSAERSTLNPLWLVHGHILMCLVNIICSSEQVYFFSAMQVRHGKRRFTAS